jgi:hypothetical protein
MRRPVLVGLSLLALAARKCHGGEIIKQEAVPNPRPMILHRLILAATSGLWLAVAGISAQGAEHNFDGVYTGKRSLTKGAPGPTCPAEDSVSITIQGDTLTFTNSAYKDKKEYFHPAPDGSFGYNLVVQGQVVIYNGRIIGDVIDADTTNPPCGYHWHLKKE